MGASTSVQLHTRHTMHIAYHISIQPPPPCIVQPSSISQPRLIYSAVKLHSSFLFLGPCNPTSHFIFVQYLLLALSLSHDHYSIYPSLVQPCMLHTNYEPTIQFREEKAERGKSGNRLIIHTISILSSV